MISEDSPLLRLPLGLVPDQKVMFDGIRHAAEISWLAFRRLDSALTWLVDAPVDDPGRKDVITAAYLDAWSLVDAIDRFRSLWKILPRDNSAPPPGVVTFGEISQAVRDVRNVTDHLATRISYVVAKGNPTMGALTWVTFDSGSKTHFKTCMLTAGTAREGTWHAVNPAGLKVIFGPSQRTAHIHIAAGEYRANLSEVIPEMQKRLKSLEKDLEESYRRQNVEGQQAGGDFFIALAGRMDSDEGGVLFSSDVP